MIDDRAPRRIRRTPEPDPELVMADGELPPMSPGTGDLSAKKTWKSRRG